MTELKEYNDLLKQSMKLYRDSSKNPNNQRLLKEYILNPLNEQEPHIKKVYQQNHPQYNLAKTNEDILFKKLLKELLFHSIEEDNYPKTGRKGYSTKEKLFAMCIKVYYRSDLRKCQSILKELKNLGYIHRVPCFKSIDNFFNDNRLSKIFDDLILISSLPVALMESTGAIDGTGFSVNNFDRWVDHKWGNEKNKQRIWRKAHAICGCKSNMFISVVVTDKRVADVSTVEEAIGNKTKYFKMDTFVADKAYSCRRVLKFLHNLGLMPVIPFKKGTRGHSGGVRIWHQMFQFHKYYNKEFMEKYHARSNIECCFHMVKNRFGGNLLTKKFTANENEIKIKFLCHNLCCLIVELFESDIFIDFEECVKTVGLCK